VEVHVSLVGRKDLTGEIYRQLRRAILDGRLPPGARLPPTRELARRLSVSRTTMTVAYDRLTGEGFVTARTGAGTFVSEAIAGPPGQPRPAGGALRPRPLWKAISVPRVVEERLAEFDFRPGIPDAGLFPYQTWRRLLAQQLRPAAVAGGVYGDPAGQPDLRRAIARHVGVSRGVQTVAGHVVVTNGTQQAVGAGGQVRGRLAHLAAHAGGPDRLHRPGQPGLVLGYGAIPTARIEEGLRRLRRCFDG